MKIGIGLALTNRRGGGAGVPPQVITATSAPTMGALTDAQTPANGYTAGTYASSAGAIASQVPTYLVNGTSQASNFDLSAGDTVQVSVLVTDSVGNTRTFLTGTTTVTAIPAPTVISAPSISGTARVGQVLTRTAGSYSGTGVTVTRQWLRNGTAIAGATGTTYTLVAADHNTDTSLRETATNSSGSVQATSNALGPVVHVAPAATANPSISGTAQVGQTLTLAHATFTGLDLTITRQWFRNGTAISGATGSTYLLIAADETATITGAETATNTGGSATATSAGVGPVAAAGGPVIPLLINRVGQSNAVTASQQSSTGTARYGSSLTNMFIWNVAAGAWQAYTLGTNTGHQGGADSGAYSVEAEIVFQMRNAGDTRPVYVIKEAVSGNGLDPVGSNGNWWPGGTYSGGGSFSQGVRWTGWLAQRSAALAAAGAPVSPTEVVCWNQGEADVNAIGSARRLDNMTAFLARVRSAVSSTAPIIIERIRPGIDGNDYGGTDQFQWSYDLREGDQAAALVDGNAVLVDADFVFPGNTGVHPAVADQTWVHGLGQRVYAAMAGTYTGTYGAINDSVPDAFTFPDSTGAALSSVITTARITPVGYQRRAAVSITGGEYQIDNIDGSLATAWTSAPGFIHPFQRIQIRTTSSASNSTAVNVTLTIGGVSDTWTVTTQAAGASLETETTAFLARASGLGGASFSGPQQTALNQLFIDLKAAGLLSGKLVRLFTSNMPDSVAATIDLVDQNRLVTQPTSSGSSVPTWSQLGWTADNVTGRGWVMGNPQTMGLSQDSSGLFAHIDPITTGAQQDLNSSDASFGLRITAAITRSQMHSTSNSQLSGQTNGPGFWAAYRSGATLTTLYGPDGLSRGTAATASVGITATAVAIHASVNQTTNNGRIRAAGVLGAGVTASDILALRNALTTYFANFG